MIRPVPSSALSSVLFSALLAFICPPLAAQAADAPAKTTKTQKAPAVQAPDRQAAQAAMARARASIVSPKDGDTVTNPVKVVFSITGMNIALAGSSEPNTGHFHLLIDTQLTDKQKKSAIPNDKQHLHFGKGESETTLNLKPGKHTLQVVMGDGKHMLHNPPVMSDVITITVK